MENIRRIILVILSYISVFILTIIIGSFVYNRGTVSGQIQRSDTGMPVVYVLTGGYLLNEMHGFKSPVDGGYLRDTITPVGKSRMINLCFDENEYRVKSVSFELYNDQYKNLIESGDCPELEKSNDYLQTQLSIRKELFSNQEYCLCIKAVCDNSEQFYYYTRIRYGSELKIAEKLQFVMDFNEATFSNNGSISSYLEPLSSEGSDLSYVTLHSPESLVTWGNLDPRRTTDINVCLKEINTETAAFTLDYSVEASGGDMTTSYNVVEYYRIRIAEDKIYLLDFERSMNETPNLENLIVSDGAIRLGIGKRSDISSKSFGSEEQEYCYIITDSSLWLYDITNRIMTSVFNADERRVVSDSDEAGIQILKTDPATGDLYFCVYGYMHKGNYEGTEGVLIYHFSHDEVKLDELMFIPYNKGFQQLRDGVETLSYMNDSGTIYLMLDDTIYTINIDSRLMETAWTDLESSRCAVSDEGVLVVAEDTLTGASSALIMTDLNTGEEVSISEDGMLVRPMGFAGDDFIYGIVEPSRVTADSEGILQGPANEIRIIDKDLNLIKSYSKENTYITRVDITDSSLLLRLATASVNGEYTDYTYSGEEYIARNVKNDQLVTEIIQKKDDIRGTQNYVSIPGSDSFIPITQIARDLDPGYDITKSYEDTGNIGLTYYVYTKGRLYSRFPTVQEAVDYANSEIQGTTVAGTIMTSHKQVIWQRAGRAYIWDLGIEKIESVKENNKTENLIILEAIADYEGWTLPNNINGSLPLYSIMKDNFPAETINISNLDLTDVLHFVYRNRLVAARSSGDHFVLITGYTNDIVTIADPTTGEVRNLSFTDAENLFKNAGNIYYSYLD